MSPQVFTLAPSPPPCEDSATFRDAKGLDCEEWLGQNCSILIEGYDSTSLKAVQDSCPVSCGYCASSAKPKVVVETWRQVAFGVELAADMSGLSPEARESSVKAAVSAALGVNLSSLSNVTIVEVSGRRLAASGTPRYRVAFEVVVPPSVQVRSIILGATSLTDPGSSAHSILTAELAGAGVDTSTLSLVVTSAPVASTVTVALNADGTVASTSAAAGSNGTASAGSAIVPLVTADCADRRDFTDEQGEGCSGWVGYNCDSVDWLRTERPYSAKGLLAVQAQCPLSCGTCSPPDRPTPEALLASCADDALIGEWCMRWRGMNCSAAGDLGYSPGYQQLLLGRCPQSCGLCGGGPPALADVAGFRDMLGYGCSDWRGYDCTKMYANYTRKGMLLVQSACQESCFNRSATQRRLQPVCEDDPSFSFLKQYTCADFVGRICTYATLYLNSRWLLGPRGALAWHENVWAHCPISCGMCDPPGRPAPHDLLAECQDDPYVGDWCAYQWKGQDCSRWGDSVSLVVPREAQRFGATLLGRCPQTCGLCQPPTCGPGSYRDTGRHACAACVPGTYRATNASGPDALSCVLSRPGFSVPRAGGVAEEPCALGTFAASAGQASCEACGPGRYAGSRASSSCSACEAGRYQPEGGASVCQRCPRGTYAAAAGLTACAACPPALTTMLEASTSDAQCACPPGQWRPLNGSACEDCPPGLVCPGGHGQFDLGPDLTVQLPPGMMSLPEDVSSAYTCVTGDAACPGYRPLPYTAELLAEVCAEQRRGPRCSQCPDGMYLASDGACEPCDSWQSSWAKGVNIVVAFALGVYMTEQCYRACQRYRSEGNFLFWGAISFGQGLVPLLKMPLSWPAIFDAPLKFFLRFSIAGLWDLWNFDLQYKCLLGQGFLYEMIKNITIPLLVFVNVGMLYLLFPLTCRKVERPMALCCIAAIWDGAWIALCVMAISLFPTDTMPNGRSYLRYSPAVEIGSRDWMIALPLGLGAIMVYVCSFIAYTIFGIMNAPRLNIEKPGFGDQFGYIIYLYTPEAYWWGGVLYATNFMYTMIQVFGSVYWQIYGTLFLLIGFMLVEAHVYPCVFPNLNRVNLVSRATTVFFTILAICFVDLQTDDVEEVSEDVPKILAAISLAVLAALLLAAGSSAYYGVGQRQWRAVHNQRVARKSRAVMTLVAVMPESKFVSTLQNFADSDRWRMQQANLMLTAVFLRMQSGRYWWQQRIIRGARAEVYDQRKVSIRADELICRRLVGAAMDANIGLHVLFDRLGELVLQRAGQKLDPELHPVTCAVAASFIHWARRGAFSNSVGRTPTEVSRSLSGMVRSRTTSWLSGSLSRSFSVPGGSSNAVEKVVSQATSLEHMAEVPILWHQFLLEFRGRNGFTEPELLQLYEALDHERTGEVPLARIVALILSHADCRPEEGLTALPTDCARGLDKLERSEVPGADAENPGLPFVANTKIWQPLVPSTTLSNEDLAMLEDLSEIGLEGESDADSVVVLPAAVPRVPPELARADRWHSLGPQSPSARRSILI